MKLYKITVHSESGYTGKLHSDTLFGAFCWSYRDIFGEECLINEVISPSITGNPVCIFSNGFPEGTLPFPAGMREQIQRIHTREAYENIKEEMKNSYQRDKKLKKTSFVTIDVFKQIQNGQYDVLLDNLKKENTEYVEQVRNQVSRISGTVIASSEGSHLYLDEYNYDRDLKGHDIYILSSIEKERLNSVMIRMFEAGIGGRKSIGKGLFQYSDLVEDNELSSIECVDSVMTLGNLLPAQNDPISGWYKTEVKYGKLDREYAVSDHPFKKPLIFICAGARFMYDCNTIPLWFGRCERNVAYNNDKIITSGYSIVLPMHILDQSA